MSKTVKIKLELTDGNHLDTSNLNFKEIDAFAQSWNPGAKWVNFNPMISKNRFSREEYFYTVADNLYEFIVTFIT